jgi:hypothetical protein
MSSSVTHRNPSGPQVIYQGFASPEDSTREEKDSPASARPVVAPSAASASEQVPAIAVRRQAMR